MYLSGKAEHIVSVFLGIGIPMQRQFLVAIKKNKAYRVERSQLSACNPLFSHRRLGHDIYLVIYWKIC
jgi:hypothetical protein